MGRFDQRQGFLVSAIVHMMILTILSSRPPGPRWKSAREQRREPAERRQIVFLPPPEVLRQLLPVPLQPPEPAKDRVSIGPPSDQRAKGALLLRREDDLTAVGPRGRPNAAPSAEPVETGPSSDGRAGPEEVEAREGLRLAPGGGSLKRGQEGSRKSPGSLPIASSLKRLEQRLQQAGPLGLPTGTGQQMGPLFFDPEGADFTLWINHFKNEVYRNWIVPQPALLGFRGHVDIEFTAERDGTVTNLKLLKSSGTPALDRAAHKALLGARLLPLPAEFGPPRAPMQVTFYYGEGPQGS